MKQQKNAAKHKTVYYEPDRVILMVVILAVLTLVLFGAITAL